MDCYERAHSLIPEHCTPEYCTYDFYLWRLYALGWGTAPSELQAQEVMDFESFLSLSLLAKQKSYTTAWAVQKMLSKLLSYVSMPLLVVQSTVYWFWLNSLLMVSSILDKLRQALALLDGAAQVGCREIQLISPKNAVVQTSASTGEGNSWCEVPLSLLRLLNTEFYDSSIF